MLQVLSVDAVQGSEAEATVLSLVKTKPDLSSFFLDKRRACVALSRAKFAGIIIGNTALFQGSRDKAGLWHKVAAMYKWATFVLKKGSYMVMVIPGITHSNKRKYLNFCSILQQRLQTLKGQVKNFKLDAMRLFCYLWTAHGGALFVVVQLFESAWNQMYNDVLLKVMHNTFPLVLPVVYCLPCLGRAPKLRPLRA